MKKIIAMLLACLFAAMPLAGCHKEEKKKSSVVVAKHQTSDDCEDAFREFFTATYSENAGEICLAYMYPAKVLNAYRNSNEYEDFVYLYNNHQSKFVNSLTQIPEIKEINSIISMNDEQLDNAKHFYLDKMPEYAEEFKGLTTKDLVDGLTEDDVIIKKGAEISYIISGFGGESTETDDKEIIVYIENDGWKIIPFSLERLTEIYSGEASEPAT